MISLISAYILKQRGYVDDPDEAHNKIKPKSWFKQIMADYPTSFEEHEGFSVLGGSSTMVTYMDNQVYNQNTGAWEKVSVWKMYLAQVDDYTPNVAAWMQLVSHGNYISPGSLNTHEGMTFYTYRAGSQYPGIGATLRVDYNGTISSRGVYLQSFAKHNDVLEVGFVPGVSASYDIAYPIDLEIKVPIFSNEATGIAYAQAAADYKTNPTQANYEAVCAYIDLCLNPDG